MSDRERFEAYVADKHPEITEGMTNVLWLVWQAAQAAPVEPQKLEAQEPLKLVAPIAYAAPPADMVCVPREPTPDTIDAMREAYNGTHALDFYESDGYTERNKFIAAYKAVIAGSAK